MTESAPTTVGPLTISAEQMIGDERLRQVIDALTDMFIDLRAGRIESPARTLLEYDRRAQLLVSPAVWQGRGVATVKVTTITPDNADRGLPLIHGIVILTDLVTGQVVAVLEGAELTAIRTGAVAGLATDRCAAADAGELAIIGAGVQARALLRAICAVRGIRRIRLFSRTMPRTHAFAEWIRGQTTAAVEVCDSIRLAVEGAQIICTTTSTDEARPLVRAEWVTPGAHLNVIGGTTEESLEVEPALLGSAFVVVEERASALAEAGEVRAAIAAGAITDAQLHELGALLGGEVAPKPGQTTLFRSVGLALEDTAAAAALYAASRNGVGR